MKKDQRGPSKLHWEHMEMASKNSLLGFSLKKLTGLFILLALLTYTVYSLNIFLLGGYICKSCMNCGHKNGTNLNDISARLPNASIRVSAASSATLNCSHHGTRALEAVAQKLSASKTEATTELKHLVFGIAASSKLWNRRRNYTRLWWRADKMRGFVWLDQEPKSNESDGESSITGLPPIKISGNTSHLKYSNKIGHRSALRISRIVSETFRLGLPDVHWFVMGDDDTVFVTENLLRVLSKYDHRQMYYIGSISESHLQNIHFSYSMAYGGGGFAISYPLAQALESIQDSCMQRYPDLYGSDDRVQACMAELGIPLTRESGFHQFDVYGNLFGLLAAHPLTPLVSLHHLDVVEPIFPNKTRTQALQHLLKAADLDSAGVLQQSICYDRKRKWSVSVSWGYAVQIFRGIFPPRQLEMPSRTFLNWYKRADYTAYPFNTRPVSRHPCQKPFVFYMKDIFADKQKPHILRSNYTKSDDESPKCRWRMASPELIQWVEVTKRKQIYSIKQAPRRNCCRTRSSNKKRIQIEVGVCNEGEIIVL